VRDCKGSVEKKEIFPNFRFKFILVVARIAVASFFPDVPATSQIKQTLIINFK
jgi:hypothetical protein